MQGTTIRNYIKIYIKIAPTCFGAVIPPSGSALFVPAIVTLVKIANYGTWVCDSVVMWLHLLVGPCWYVYVALFGSRLYFRTVQHTHANKATSPPN